MAQAARLLESQYRKAAIARDDPVFHRNILSKNGNHRRRPHGGHMNVTDNCSTMPAPIIAFPIAWPLAFFFAPSESAEIGWTLTRVARSVLICDRRRFLVLGFNGAMVRQQRAPARYLSRLLTSV